MSTLADITCHCVDVDLAKLNLGTNPERLVLSTTTGSSGTAEIVYRTGGTVSVDQLERLCQRVGWPPRPVDKVKGALENSFLVRCLCAALPCLDTVNCTNSLQSHCIRRARHACKYLCLLVATFGRQAQHPRVIGPAANQGMVASRLLATAAARPLPC
jgi:hypothetical protein